MSANLINLTDDVRETFGVEDFIVEETEQVPIDLGGYERVYEVEPDDGTVDALLDYADEDDKEDEDDEDEVDEDDEDDNEDDNEDDEKDEEDEEDDEEDEDEDDGWLDDIATKEDTEELSDKIDLLRQHVDGLTSTITLAFGLSTVLGVAALVSITAAVLGMWRDVGTLVR